MLRVARRGLSSIAGVRVVASGGKRAADGSGGGARAKAQARLAERMRERAVVSVSAAAARRLRELLDARPASDAAADAIRLGLRTRGCNGLAYTLAYTRRADAAKFDEVVDTGDGGVPLVVAPNALMSVIGTRMDYVEDALKSEFVFENPNATSTCGCGESFAI